MKPDVRSPEGENKPAWWDQVSARDFDGHTNFRLLTPVQRLMWLSQLQRFVATARGAARKGSAGR